jgi:hypothetical protein
MRRISNACISGAPCSLGPRPFPGSPRAIATDGPGSSLGDRSVLGSGSTLEGGSVANMRRTTVSSAAAYRIRERVRCEACGIGRRSAARRQRDDFLGCQWACTLEGPARESPAVGWSPASGLASTTAGIRALAGLASDPGTPHRPLPASTSTTGFQQLACVLTYAWRVSRCENNI